MVSYFPAPGVVSLRMRASGSQESSIGPNPAWGNEGAAGPLGLFKGRQSEWKEGTFLHQKDASSLCEINHLLFNHKGIIFPS